jgi:hypothetical protein
MLKIQEYSNFFIKRSFNLPQYKYKKIKKIVEKRDNLFYEFFHKINNIDISSYRQYNELQEKTKLSEGINNLKIKNKEYILNNLMYEPNISLITLNALCKFYNINLIYLHDRIYIKMCHNDDLPIIVINNECKFIDTNTEINDKYEITNLEKPLNSVSYYKLNELVEFAIQLNLPYEKIKKADLYNSIYNYLVKLNIFKID